MLQMLLVEDDPQLASHLATLFRDDGWKVDLADSIEALSDQIASPMPGVELVVLDRLMGRTDTRNLFPVLRRVWPKAAILVLSAINTPAERADLLDLGADDYVGKPFLGKELLARARAVVRRSRTGEEVFRKVGNTVLDFNRRSIRVGDGEEALMPLKEFSLLKLLTRDVGRVFGREDLLAALWGPDTPCESNVVEATVNQLRRRLESNRSSIHLKNLRNAGYFAEA